MENLHDDVNLMLTCEGLIHFLSKSLYFSPVSLRVFPVVGGWVAEEEYRLVPDKPKNFVV